MLFTKLLSDAGLRPLLVRGEADVQNVQADSRRCGPGSCFVAAKGPCEDGHRFIGQAISAGAAAVVCQDAAAVPPAMPMARLESAREAPGLLAQAMLGWPARRLVSVGLTGTKGKSTTACLIRAVLAEAGQKAGLLGTIAYDTGRRALDAHTTTPGPVELAHLTAEMAQAGCSHLVMEVSSHALDQGRTAGLEFQVAVFTNLSGDHMDYHRTPEHYAAAKRRLFEDLSPSSAAVINRDDPAGRTMAEAAKGRVVWFGCGEGADLRAAVRRIDYDGMDFDVDAGPRRLAVRTPLMGRHNVYNCLAAMGAADAMGIDLGLAVRAIGKLDRVPGRLQRVPVEAPYKVFVDYAHTDDALRNVLETLRGVERAGRVIAVFGCGGDRDRTKRPRMARVAERLADRVVITSDNPRSEDPAAIIEEVAAGLSPAGRARTEIQADRRIAIARAIELAGPGDVVLIAGKGHETYQILPGGTIHFDDSEVAAELMRGRRGEKGAAQ
jgi:UDP-N-acetylmuramoyl-L-alanyl-D-glutamate--2,6-diaminopimelate ligase